MTIEIQCTSCHTRYRIDERVLPEDTPTFKCSRCGHVFSADPRGATQRETPPPAQSRAAGPSRTARERPPRPHPANEPRPPADFTKPASSGSAEKSETAAEDHPLNRSFADVDEGFKQGETVSFDFSEDDAPEPPPPSEIAAEPQEKWEVGETTAAATAAAHQHGPDHLVEPERPPPVTQPEPPAERDRRKAVREIEEEELPEPRFKDPGPMRGSGFFIGLFLAVVLAFAALSLIMAGAPQASADFLATVPVLGAHFIRTVTPDKMVALQDIHADYRGLKEDQGRPALVITGQAHNLTDGALHTVQIEAVLGDNGGHELARQSVYCGNVISGKMIGEMTRRELNFFQKLDPPKAFVLKGGQTSPFMVAFFDPPPSLTKFGILVVKVQPAEEPPTLPSGM